jgi:dTMP kinase
MARRGTLIAFEGLDRSGKRTQFALLQNHLGAMGRDSVAARFPSRTTRIGALLDAYLRGEEGCADRAVHLLFAADRWDRADAIRGHLAAGRHVICDRYSFSGAAYSASKGLSRAWCWASECGLPAPDVVFQLLIEPAIAASRSGFGAERFECVETQRRVALEFDWLRTATASQTHWHTLDATLPPSDLHTAIAEVVDDVVRSRPEALRVLRALDAREAREAREAHTAPEVRRAPAAPPEVRRAPAAPPEAPRAPAAPPETHGAPAAPPESRGAYTHTAGAERE